MVFLKKTTEEDINFIHLLWNDEATMEAVGGISNRSYDEVRDWYAHISAAPLKSGMYRLIIDENKTVGEVSFRGFDETTREAWFNIKVLAKYRNKGYASQAAKLMLKEFFFTFNGLRMLDNMGISNVQGQKFLERLGFSVIDRSDEEVVYALDRDTFIRDENNKES